MSDDIARQRFWSQNNAKADPVTRLPRAHQPRSPRRGGAERGTHVLLVKQHGRREWFIVSGGKRDVSGSEAFCLAEMATRSRHWPDDEFCVLTWPDAQRELRRKTWSVNDEDHVPVGSQVMLRRAPVEIHPGMEKVRRAFGLSPDGEQRRTGVIKSRNRRSGGYMVKLDGTGIAILVERADLIYPVPDNVVAFERRPDR